jgi:selenocysteine-specific elongation factor
MSHLTEEQLSALVDRALEGRARSEAERHLESCAACREALAGLARAAVLALERFHREQPLRPGMAREELRTRVFAQAPPQAFERVLADLAADGRVKAAGDVLAAARHQVTLSAGEGEARLLVLEAAEAALLAGVEVAELAGRTGRDARLLERVGRVLVTERVLDRVGEGLLIHRRHLETLKEEVRRRWPPGSRLDVSAFKEYTGLSRKYVIPLLEYLDRERVTRRAGNDRLVLG